MGVVAGVVGGIRRSRHGGSHVCLCLVEFFVDLTHRDVLRSGRVLWLLSMCVESILGVLKRAGPHDTRQYAPIKCV